MSNTGDHGNEQEWFIHLNDLFKKMDLIHNQRLF